MTAQQTIAVLGASTDRNKFGNAAVRTYIDKGWTVYPINPKADEIEGVKAYASITELPKPIHRVSVYLPPQILITVLDEIAVANPDEVWLNPGTESDRVLERASQLGLNVIQACSIVDQGVSPAQYMG